MSDEKTTMAEPYTEQPTAQPSANPGGGDPGLYTEQPTPTPPAAPPSAQIDALADAVRAGLTAGLELAIDHAPDREDECNEGLRALASLVALAKSAPAPDPSLDEARRLADEAEEKASWYAGRSTGSCFYDCSKTLRSLCAALEAERAKVRP